MDYKVLVVEDDAQASALCRRILSADGAAVFTAPTVREGLLLAEDSLPDVVLSDVELPDADGFELCRRLRSRPRTSAIPIMLMSGARIGVSDQAEGIEGGADDYILKPFDSRLLCAKLRALLRRSSGGGSSLEFGALKVDLDARTVEVRGKPVPTTRKEFDLLAAMLRKPSKVLSVAHLLETVWGHDPAEYNDPRTVKVHFSSLRKKLGTEGRRIVNVPGHGYRFDP